MSASSHDRRPSAAATDPPSPLSPDTAAAVAAVYDLYDPPLWLVTAAEGPEPGSRRGGCIATFVARASIIRDMPRMVAGIARQHHTWRMIEASGRFCVHLLPEDRLDLVRRFALSSGKQHDKYADLPDGPEQRTPEGSPFIAGTLSWLDCRVETRMSTGDRSVYIAAVTGGGVLDADAGPPLTAARLMALMPEPERAELDRLYARDGGIDAEAIRRWRAGE
jgi:flavin reductase (DIM6/NTAB) family NADH-FMN oxidoreductase RutF